MGQPRNFPVKLNLQEPELSLAKAMGINPAAAMFVARARGYVRDPSTPNSDCQEMTHVVIAKDVDTYDHLAAQGEDLGIPLPIDMIMDSRMRTSAPPHAIKGFGDGGGGGASAIFASCCSRSRDVTVVIVGEVGGGKKGPRFFVSPDQSVQVKVEDGNKPPNEKHVVEANIFSGHLNTCRDQK